VTHRYFRLIVEGELSDELEPAFHGMKLTRAEGNTTITGNVRDQAELHGLLQRVSDLGLTLLEAKAIDERPERRSEVDPLMCTDVEPHG
jgi:hypothetical protein